MRRKNTHCIVLFAPDGYVWVGRRCLPISEVYGDDGRPLYSYCNIRDFKTTRKAMNVLWSLPKGIGAYIYREYWRKGDMVRVSYAFNTKKETDNFRKGGYRLNK